MPRMKGEQDVKEMCQPSGPIKTNWQNLLEASGWYLKAQEHHLHQEYQGALEDPGKSEHKLVQCDPISELKQKLKQTV